MNSSIVPQQFDFQNEYSVRAFEKDGETWFVAADVCGVLEIVNARNAVARLDDDEKGVATVDTPGGPQQMSIINESGLYSLILTSRKPEAKAFKHWITHEVLPSLRKTGQYALASMTPAELGLYHAQRLVDHERMLHDHEDRLLQIEANTQETMDYYTVVGYGNLRRTRFSSAEASQIGRRAAALSRERGIEVRTTHHAHWGVVNTYDVAILDEVTQPAL